MAAFELQHLPGQLTSSSYDTLAPPRPRPRTDTVYAPLGPHATYGRGVSSQPNAGALSSQPQYAALNEHMIYAPGSNTTALTGSSAARTLVLQSVSGMPVTGIRPMATVNRQPRLVDGAALVKIQDGVYYRDASEFVAPSSAYEDIVGLPFSASSTDDDGDVVEVSRGTLNSRRERELAAAEPAPVLVGTPSKPATKLRVSSHSSRRRRVMVVGVVLAFVLIAGAVVGGLFGGGVIGGGNAAASTNFSASSVGLQPPFGPIHNLDIVNFPGDDAALGTLLSQVHNITGRLLVLGNPKLIDLSGLASLVSVGAYIYIRDNPNLVSLAGLRGLRGVYGSSLVADTHLFVLSNNSKLADGEGLLHLTCKAAVGDFFCGKCQVCTDQTLEKLLSRHAALATVDGGKSCEDVNECGIETHNCASVGSSCKNTVGSFLCACLQGYNGDGVTCAAIPTTTASTLSTTTVVTQTSLSETLTISKTVAPTTLESTTVQSSSATLSAYMSSPISAESTTESTTDSSVSSTTAVPAESTSTIVINDTSTSSVTASTESVDTPVASTAISSAVTPQGTTLSTASTTVSTFLITLSTTAARETGNSATIATTASPTSTSTKTTATTTKPTNSTTPVTSTTTRTTTKTTPLTTSPTTASTPSTKLSTITISTTAITTGSTPVFTCDSKPCAANATCIDKPTGRTCTCKAGFSGDGNLSCININDCASHPCLNNGACVDGINFFRCDCVANWTGLTCDVRVPTFFVCDYNNSIKTPLNLTRSVFKMARSYASNQQCWASFALPNGSQIYVSCTFSTQANVDYWRIGGGNLTGQLSFASMNSTLAALPNNKPLNGTGSISASFTGGLQFTWFSDASIISGTGFTCNSTLSCAPGFSGDGINCVDPLDACISNPCLLNNTHCVDLPPPALDDAAGRNCVCNVGFTGDGITSCSDVNECSLRSHSCKFTVGKCAQANEYNVSTLSCDPDDAIANITWASYGPLASCSSKNSTCGTSVPSSISNISAACVNKTSCTVPATNAYWGDPCQGYNKKLAVYYTCSNLAFCHNTKGSFTCSCKYPGYSAGDGGECKNIDACVHNPCTGVNTTCTDLPPPALDDVAGRVCS